MSFISFYFVFLCILNVKCDPYYISGTVYIDTNGEYSVDTKTMDCTSKNVVACGYFNTTLNETGWATLEILLPKTTNNNEYKITDENKMYAGGLLEGYLTSKEIYLNYLSLWMNRKDSILPYKNNLTKWFDEQNIWINSEIKSNNDKYWTYMSLLQTQFNGLQSGYNMSSIELGLPVLNEFDFMFMNSLEEIGDIINSFKYAKDPSLLPDWKNMDNDTFLAYVLKHGSCSGFVKITPEIDNIYFSHSTWTDFYRMNRIYKHYKFNLNQLNPSSTHMSLSSFPGILTSIDDYYIMNNGLAVMETTNGIYNNSLWEYVIPQSLLTWQRVRISNAISITGLDWVNNFAKYNSGTYNNQWIILDYKLFKPNEPLNDGLLYILEQIPGNCSYMDVTNILERGYWASYNVAAIEYIYNVSGTAQNAHIHGTSSSYDLAPRARLFRKYNYNAYNMSMIEKLMRYNDYKHDPLQNNDPTWAIMARGDLKSSNPYPSGGIDTKIADLNMMNNVYAVLQNGPTHDNTPTFNWNDWPNIYHIGIPIQYDFDWIQIPSILN